ncbi:hypothetical protein BKA58DRAFT_168065 [Alternaria rosae]|uniref:uncharacterized protein n=1 Tax=Alternaria rosae TaxID=1187941 RepID=UPI001E8CDB6D|nr:uncharacterized protein BKA58DRAFT_168065 [Alternaria rosae]KAH6869954.1 hypothetical protein BKA58DRAFT_168065 [Alternaria rosae]
MRNHAARGHLTSLAAVATAKGCLPNGVFPDCFTFSLAPSCVVCVSKCFTTLDGSSSAWGMPLCNNPIYDPHHHLSPPHHPFRHLVAHLALHPHPISRNAFDCILGTIASTPPVLFPSRHDPNNPCYSAIISRPLSFSRRYLCFLSWHASTQSERDYCPGLLTIRFWCWPCSFSTWLWQCLLFASRSRLRFILRC